MTPSIRLTSFTFGFQVIAFAIGCGGHNVKTHPVQGRLNVKNGNIALLAGHTIEVALDADPKVRAAGVIQDDGTFELETVQGAAVLKGALPGAYKARIVLGDDDPAKRNGALKAFDPRYFNFEKSGLALAVPSPDSPSLTILRR